MRPATTWRKLNPSFITLTRGKRIVLEVIAPPFLGSSLSIAAGVIMHLAQGGSWDFIRLQGRDYLVTYFWAYLLGGLPSVGYMLVMEWRFGRGLDPRSRHAVGMSTLLGAGAGVIITAPLTIGHPGVWLYLGGIGAVVGLVLGLLIRQLSAVSDRVGTAP